MDENLAVKELAEKVKIELESIKSVYAEEDVTDA